MHVHTTINIDRVAIEFANSLASLTIIIIYIYTLVVILIVFHNS